MNIKNIVKNFVVCATVSSTCIFMHDAYCMEVDVSSDNRVAKGMSTVTQEYKDLLAKSVPCEGSIQNFDSGMFNINKANIECLCDFEDLLVTRLGQLKEEVERTEAVKEIICKLIDSLKDGNKKYEPYGPKVPIAPKKTPEPTAPKK